MSVRDVIAHAVLGWGYSDDTLGRGDDILAALAAAGLAVVPVEMTPEQARRSLAGHALPDRVRDANPAEYKRIVAMRQATWRQLVAAMGEAGDEG